MIRFKHKFLLVLLIVTIIGLVESISVDALTTSTTGITSVGASTIVIDLDWREPSSISTTGSLTYGTDASDIIGIYYNGYTSLSSGSSLSGTYTVKYENCGYDSEGDEIDLTIYSEVTTKNTHSYGTCTWPSGYSIFVGYANYVFSVGCQYRSLSSYDTTTSNTTYTTYVKTTQDITVTVTKHGSTTKATGNYLFYVCDIDIVHSTSGIAETVELGSGFSSTVYLDEYTTVGVSGTKYYATEEDDATEVSSLTTLASVPFEFTWSGANCMTGILQSFGTSTITSKIYTSVNRG